MADHKDKSQTTLENSDKALVNSTKSDETSENNNQTDDKAWETTHTSKDKALENGNATADVKDFPNTQTTANEKVMENYTVMETVTNPIGRLQENYQYLGAPSYITLESTGASHAPTFTIQVSLGDIKATASGSSKKAAKHGAAQAMLHLLKQTKPGLSGTANQTNTPPPNQTTTPPPNQPSTSIPNQTNISPPSQKPGPTAVSGNMVGTLQELCTARSSPVNCVGTLQELCTGRSLPLPRYELEQSSGPSHQPQFRMVCVVQHRRLAAVAGNKKDAKREAARAMLVDIEAGAQEENKKDETMVEGEGDGDSGSIKCEQGNVDEEK